MSRRPTSKPNPFRCFNSSPEVIRLAVQMYVRHPLSLRSVEDLLFEMAAITTELAGALYGSAGIPDKWLEQLAWRERIEEMAEGCLGSGPIDGARVM